MTSLRIVHISSPDRAHKLPEGVRFLNQHGFQVTAEPILLDTRWPYTAGSVKDRLAQLTQALQAKSPAFIVAARGGYGASDLLAHIPWEKAAQWTPKTLVGCSDLCAIYSAVYAKTGWPAIHASMPANGFYAEPLRPDTNLLLRLLRQEKLSHSYAIQAFNEAAQKLRGPLTSKLFGGCLSVLTNLIGTPYLPEIKNHILFFEDITENPGRLVRMMNQWSLAGLLDEVPAVIFGQFIQLGGELPDNADFVYEELGRRLPCPVFRCLKFGHGAENWPVPVGRPATIENDKLHWQYA